MSSNDRKRIMRDKILNVAFPMTGGSLGASTIINATITWPELGDMALKASVLAFIGGVIGWGVKRLLDWIFKKK